ncbi:serine hydrolase domain-containing protein [Vibrio mexicanus]|uniref:serine hydrolase domain-containing protein n=1 Tax=Vibrio mexicanus TaxID=1004326 RepID=UPI00063C3B95|nr:serine hydrolase domain-containing protein [Vibrio mexicanus]
MKFLPWLALFTLFSSFASANSERINTLLDDYITLYGAENITTVISHGDDVIFSGSAGSDPLWNPDTTTLIASLSKPITATAVIILEQQGKIDISQPITTYIPDLKLADGRENDLTIRRLMSHTSGLSSQNFRYQYQPNDSLESLIDLMAQASLYAEPDENWYYSNLGYDLLGLLVERVSGQSFAQFLKDSLFTPLGMDSSGTPQHLPIETTGHISLMRVSIPVRSHPAEADIPSGYLLSSADDYNRFLRFQRDGLGNDGQAILSMSALKLMHDAASIPQAYSYGWSHDTYFGMKGIGHDGDVDGYLAKAVYIPEADLSVVILSNSYNLPQSLFAIRDLTQAMIAEVIGEDHSPNPIIKWLSILLPLLIVADLFSSVRGIVKVRQGKGQLSEKQKRQVLLQTSVKIASLLAMPWIIGIILGRGMGYHELFNMAPNLTLLLASSVILESIRLIVMAFTSPHSEEHFRQDENQLTH